MRNERQHTLDRAVVRTLLAMSGLPIAEMHLLDVLLRAFTPPDPRATRTEADDAIAWMTANSRVRPIPTETGKKYVLTELGRAWAMEEGLV